MVNNTRNYMWFVYDFTCIISIIERIDYNIISETHCYTTPNRSSDVNYTFYIRLFIFDEDNSIPYFGFPNVLTAQIALFLLILIFSTVLSSILMIIYITSSHLRYVYSCNIHRLIYRSCAVLRDTIIVSINPVFY